MIELGCCESVVLCENTLPICFSSCVRVCVCVCVRVHVCAKVFTQQTVYARYCISVCSSLVVAERIVCPGAQKPVWTLRQCSGAVDSYGTDKKKRQNDLKHVLDYLF